MCRQNRSEKKKVNQRKGKVAHTIGAAADESEVGVGERSVEVGQSGEVAADASVEEGP